MENYTLIHFLTLSQLKVMQHILCLIVSDTIGCDSDEGSIVAELRLDDLSALNVELDETVKDNDAKIVSED